MTSNLFDLSDKSMPSLKEFAERIPGGFVIYQENENRDILFVNSSLLKIYGCQTIDEFKDLTGWTFPGMVYPDDFNKIQSSIDTQIEGEHGKHDHVEYRIKTRDGSIRWVDDYGYFTHSKNYGDCYYVFIVDVTEQKLAQETRRAFFFNMSHEIITPLNAVSSYIQLAMGHRENPVLMEEYLEDAGKSVKKLISLVDKLMEIDREDGWVANTEKYSIAQEENEKYRILVAEDLDVNQILLRTILEEASFNVEIVDDGGDAVEAVKSHEAGYYSVVLMDIRMKDMNGYEATRRIRQLPQGSFEALPIFALSANARAEDKAASAQSGMNGHLAKPYNPEQIIEVIRRAVKKGECGNGLY